MRTIVFLKDGTKHSAWSSIEQAIKQIKVLENCGYRNCYYKCIDHNYINGYYFV